MEASYHRHHISDEVWALLEPHLPGQRGQWGGIAQDNRRFINRIYTHIAKSDIKRYQTAMMQFYHEVNPAIGQLSH